MSSSANTAFWNDPHAAFDVGIDFGGYSFDFGKVDTTAPTTTAPATTAPATTTTTTGGGVVGWVQKNPLAVGVGVVAIVALAALSMGRK